MLSTILKYLLQNKIYSAIAVYYFGAVILKKIYSVDILIPCIWKSVFGIKCPGCGLTTASISLINFDFPEAFNANPLIFIIIPIGLVFVCFDYLKFKKAE